MEYELKFLEALFFTSLIEMFVVGVIFKHIFKATLLKTTDAVLLCFFVSALTLPYFWFVLPVFMVNKLWYVLVGEIVIIIIEALFYYKLLNVSSVKAMQVSLLANLGSVLLGYLN